jgi:hypothetical protein
MPCYTKSLSRHLVRRLGCSRVLAVASCSSGASINAAISPMQHRLSLLAKLTSSCLYRMYVTDIGCQAVAATIIAAL